MRFLSDSAWTLTAFEVLPPTSHSCEMQRSSFWQVVAVFLDYLLTYLLIPSQLGTVSQVTGCGLLCHLSSVLSLSSFLQLTISPSSLSSSDGTFLVGCQLNTIDLSSDIPIQCSNHPSFLSYPLIDSSRHANFTSPVNNRACYYRLDNLARQVIFWDDCNDLYFNSYTYKL